MIEFEAFAKADQLMRATNEAILENEQLGADDVKQYLHKVLEVGWILEGVAPPMLANRYRKATDLLGKSLEQWDADRSDALFHLLQQVSADREHGVLPSRSASAKCAQVLLTEPLVPVDNLELYRSLLTQSQRILVSVEEKGADTPLAELFQTFAAGIRWNATRFCPRIFDDAPSEEEVKQARDFFLTTLVRLQGLPPFVQ